MAACDRIRLDRSLLCYRPAPYFLGMSHQKDHAIRDLLDRASSRKFEATHGDVPVDSLREDVLDDYPAGWLEARQYVEEDYWQAMREAAPAAWDLAHDDGVRRIVQAALDCDRPPQQVTQDPAFHNAIDGLAQATASNRQEIIWRALRTYLLACLHTHETGLASREDLATRRRR